VGHGELTPGSADGFVLAFSKAPQLTAGLLFASLGQGAVPF
jgi:hypothetical protein